MKDEIEEQRVDHISRKHYNRGREDINQEEFGCERERMRTSILPSDWPSAIVDTLCRPPIGVLIFCVGASPQAFGFPDGSKIRLDLWVFATGAWWIIMVISTALYNKRSKKKEESQEADPEGAQEVTPLLDEEKSRDHEAFRKNRFRMKEHGRSFYGYRPQHLGALAWLLFIGLSAIGMVLFSRNCPPS